MCGVRPCFQSSNEQTHQLMYNSFPSITAGGSTNLTLLELLRSRREKGKKGGKNGMKIAPRQCGKMEEKMKRRNTKRKQQHKCDVGKIINTIEKATSTAMKIYRAVEPVIKAILKNGRKAK
jgi:hypothetical protein